MTSPEDLGEIEPLTEAQRRTLSTLGDGDWHRGSRTGENGGVLGTPAVALVRMGLVERRGSSRTANPQNPGYEYRLTLAGWEAVDEVEARAAESGSEAQP